MLRLSDDLWAGKGRLLRLLADLEASGWCRRTLYLRPDSLASRTEPSFSAPDASEARISAVLRQAGVSETGLVIFSGDKQMAAVVPPFPVSEDAQAEGAHISRLVDLLNHHLLIGVVLLRLGRYAVGVLRGDDLLASKTGSRYVKRRHRAGGSSQRRFERSRERLVRELFDKTCEVTRDVFSPYGERIDYLLMGGERHTLGGFLQRCGYLKAFEQRTLERVLQVDRPGQAALKTIAFEVWKSRVLSFAVDGEPDPMGED